MRKFTTPDWPKKVTSLKDFKKTYKKRKAKALGLKHYKHIPNPTLDFFLV